MKSLISLWQNKLYLYQNMGAKVLLTHLALYSYNYNPYGIFFLYN